MRKESERGGGGGDRWIGRGWYDWGTGRGEGRMMNGGWMDGMGWMWAGREGKSSCCAGVLGYGDVDGFSKRGKVLS